MVRTLQADPGAYVADLINQPWDARRLHCWRLVRQVVRDLYDIRVPLVMGLAPEGRAVKADLFNHHPERQRWIEVESPGEWAIALMARRGAPPDLIEHAGVYLALDGSGILHSDAPHGVVFDSLFMLPRIRTWAHPVFLVPR